MGEVGNTTKCNATTSQRKQVGLMRSPSTILKLNARLILRSLREQQPRITTRGGATDRFYHRCELSSLGQQCTIIELNRQQRMDKGWWAMSLPPASSVNAKDEVENCCQRHKSPLCPHKKTCQLHLLTAAVWCHTTLRPNNQLTGQWQKTNNAEKAGNGNNSKEKGTEKKDNDLVYSDSS